ncbi:60S acidic ribosomal protein P1-like [Pipistrellus kuhlii]|uniref:60S acidic ribosomal protein P1-like n=1 Tax=Pipistrellus kuhlii TaxID=59472 RepID=UPI00174F1A0B|nr:60S acidic ribosomal protein P1-like [Pipistrellus kuhlii]
MAVPAQHSPTPWSSSPLACITSLQPEDEEDKINALIKAAGVNGEPSCHRLFFAEALAHVNIGSLMCNAGSAGPALPASAASAGVPAPSTTAALAEEKKVEAKKEESEEPEDDMGFDLLD